MPLLTAGCAAGLRLDVPEGVGPAELLRGEPLVGQAALAPVPDVDLLGLDAEMRQFVDEHVSASGPRDRRLRQLLRAVIVEGRLAMEYNQRTHSAREAFHSREGNCLSFTNMFIALGRYAGLNVSYQEVDIPPDWTRDGDSLVLNRHIDALVVTGEGSDQVVDFNMADFRTSYDRRVVSDDRGLAHFYSNIAVERMQDQDTTGALRYIRKALERDPGFTAAWVNLGSLYLRHGHQQWARAAWYHALSLDPGEPVAMSNLERLERELGNIRVADDLRGRIGRYRLENPYYRYYLAQDAFHRGDYDASIAHLKYALRAKQDEDRFMALLGLSYLSKGDRESAERWIARAEDVATDVDSQRTYHSKLELLRRIGAG